MHVTAVKSGRWRAAPKPSTSPAYGGRDEPKEARSMATRIETLGGRRAPKAAWIVLFAIVMVAAAIAAGTLIRSDGTTTTPARPAGEAVSTALEPATQVPGLIKAGLQPRPFSPIPVDETTMEETPAGFVKMPGGEVRPTFGA